MKKNDQMLSLTIVALIRTRTVNNPVKSKDMELMYSITGEMIRDIVRDARRAGHAIGSNGNGYFECKKFTEWEPTRKDLHSRAMSLLETIKQVDAAFANEQQEILA